MEFTPSNENEEAGIALVQDDRFHYLMILTLKNRKPFLQAYKTENGIKSLLAETEIKDAKRLYLSVQGNTINYDFYYGYTDQEMIPLIRGLKASLLSSVVNNGFTGTYIGMYTSSNHQSSTNHADFDWFNYQGE